MEESTQTILGGSDQSPIQDNNVVTGSPSPTETPAPAIEYGQVITTDGGLHENWRNVLPENIRNEKCLDNIKTFGAMVQSYVHAQKAMGAKRFAMPSENSTPEEWNEFYTTLGRPEKAESYKYDTVELPEGMSWDDNQIEEFRKFAFENGMSQKTFEAALKFELGRNKAAYETQTAAAQKEYDETLAKLQGEYGSNLPNVIMQCDSALEQFGLKEVLAENGLLNNYTVIKALANIGSTIGESRMKGDGGVPNVSSPADRLAEIRNNYDDPYYKKDHPAHKARVAEVNNLLAMMDRAKS